jgi:hypothetical protein
MLRRFMIYQLYIINHSLYLLKHNNIIIYHIINIPKYILCVVLFKPLQLSIILCDVDFRFKSVPIFLIRLPIPNRFV